MVVTSKHRTHKVMEAAIRELMGAGTPPRFKFKDTYASIEFPSGYTIPAEATLEAKYDELLALEEGIQKTVMEGDLEVGTSNLFVDTQTGNIGIGTTSPDLNLHVMGAIMTQNNGTITPQIQFKSGDSNTNGWLVRANISDTYAGDFTIDRQDNSVTPSKFVIKNNGKVGIGTTSPVQTLHVAGNGENPVIYMADSTNTRYASGMGTHHVSNEGQRLDFYNGDSGANGTSLGSSHIRMCIKHNGNVGIGTTNPTKSLEIDGTTLRHAREYRYQSDWQSNNNQTFTIPVTGGSARGEMLVEAEVIQVAANSSGERVARVRGVITNYHTGDFYMTVFEGENATAFETYIVGASLGASGTFTMKYQPQAGYQQDVRCRLNLKIFIGGYTSSLGSLTRTDAGSNSALTAPTLNSAPKIIGGNVGIGTTNPLSPLDIKAVKGITTAATANDLVSNATIRISGYAENHDVLCIGMLGTDTSGNSGNNPYAYIQNIWDTTKTARPLLLNPVGGGVGIGTTNPTSLLHIVNPSTTSRDVTVKILGGPNQATNDASRATLELHDDYNNAQGWGGYIEGFHESGVNHGMGLGSFTNGSKDGYSMFIRGDGNVGIGTMNPSAKLHVNGAITSDHYACFETNLSYYDQSDYLEWKTSDNYVSFNSGITLANATDIELGVPGIYLALVKLNSDSSENSRVVQIMAQYYDGSSWISNISNGELNINYNGGTEVMTQHMLRATTYTRWRFYINHNFTTNSNRFNVATSRWSRIMIAKIA